MVNNRLGSLSCCWLCDKPSSDSRITFEDHHIVPRHLGGTMGPLVYLCSDCHTNVHKAAEKLLAKKDLPSIYKKEEHAKKLFYLANIIFKATEALKINPTNKQYAISGRLSFYTHKDLLACQQMLSTKERKYSQIELIELAIKNLKQTLTKKGH